MAKIYGLIGERLSHSISPQIHKMIFESTGIKGVYNKYEVKENQLVETLNGLRALGILGVNVTIPYKIQIMKFLNKLSPEAEKIGSINTIKFLENKLIGYNTDYNGFSRMLNRFDVDVKGRTVVILGTGGVSRTVFHYMQDKGASKIYLLTTDLMHAGYFEGFNNTKVVLYKNFNFIDNKELDILVNCTPCGMYPDTQSCALDKGYVGKFKVVVDLVYNPVETILLKYAKEFGIKAVSGLYMLVAQAVASEEIWNNTKIDIKIIDNIYINILKNGFDTN